MARVVLLATGGTIASTQNNDGASVARRSGETLLSETTVPHGVDVHVEQVFQLNSYNVTFDEMAILANRLRSVLAEPDVDGAVVTHGTDTMEETGFFLSLLIDSERPVVLTGAQRSGDESDADGPSNLRDAIAVAADPASRGVGVVIVFDGNVWSVPATRKTWTLAAAAFDSELGPIGTVNRGEVVITRPAAGIRPFDSSGFASDGLRVDIVTCYPGADAVALDAVVAAGADGLVIEGMGVGNAGRALLPAVTALIEGGMPVILTSRVPHGPAAGIYGDGGGADLVRAGAILGGLYRAPQLRILLLVALGCSGSVDTARAAVSAFLSPTHTEAKTRKEQP